MSVPRFLRSSLANPAKPVTVEEFRGLFNSLLDKMPSFRGKMKDQRVAIAVSGGMDSLALCILAKQVIPADRLTALIVDHGLNSRGVTEFPLKVAKILENLGIRHEILKADWNTTFRESLTKGKLMEKTRELRYEALLKACRRLNIPLILTGHNLEDDIGTMFYRLAHLSGLDGLAGMKSTMPIPLKSHVASRFIVGHPLISIAKERLMATCKDWDVQWLQDESNNDMDFRRNAIMGALMRAQKENPKISTESLSRMLNNFKRIRADVHQEMVEVFNRSVIINKNNGDCTLVLNDASWIKKPYLAIRLITLLMQYCSVRTFPIRTNAVKKLYDSLVEVFDSHQQKQKVWLGRRFFKDTELMPQDMVKRIVMPSASLAHATLYSLSKNDAVRRIGVQQRVEGRMIEYGPAFLIQSSKPNNYQCQVPKCLASEVVLGPGQNYLWDGRFFINFQHPGMIKDDKARSFLISFMTNADVKEFEAICPKSQDRRNIYAYMGTTPGTHLYQIPVIREVGTNYMAFPTLKTDFPRGKYIWSTSFAGNSLLVSRFLCLP